jgi:prolyl oligopeptidase
MPTWPGFQAAIVDAGGVLVIGNLRGGGEFGDGFWQQGRLEHKQNCFDDLFALAERLIADGITTPDLLAFTGASNGGMVAAAAVTHRPDLWKAVASLVPVTDMVRFTRDDFGAQGIEEVGDDPETLAAWSPYERVAPRTSYPATLVACAGDDVRCPPWHGRKLVAAMQEATSGVAPIMLRAWPGASHLTVFYEAEAAADWVGFVMEQLELTPVTASGLRGRSAPAETR